VASILFADALPALVPVPEEIEAIERAAAYFERQGHRTEVIFDPRQVTERNWSELPDVIVTDMLGWRDGLGLMGELERQHAERKTGVLVLASVTAESGFVLGLSERIPHLIEGYVIRPYHAGMSLEQQGRFRIFLSFQEQLVVSVGHLLYRRGLESPGAATQRTTPEPQTKNHSGHREQGENTGRNPTSVRSQ
jgi:hypothetical protein